MLKQKSILITGAAGFIGSHLTDTLLKHDNFLVLIDNLNDYYPGKERRLNSILQNYEPKKDYILLKDNILNPKIYNKIDSNIDYIFHLAAQAGVRYSIAHASEISYNNIIGTINFLEFAKKIEDIKRFVFSSSSSVYGNPIYTPCDENHPKNPISPYAISKLASEIYINYYFKHQNIPSTILRFYTVYGPHSRPDMAIAKFFKRIREDQPLIIFGDGEQLRDFTYISDIIDGIILSCENSDATGEIFNLGNSNPISINNLIKIMYKMTKSPKKVHYDDPQMGDVNITHSNIEKAKKIFNFNPKVRIEEGLIKYYEWLKDSK